MQIRTQVQIFFVGFLIALATLATMNAPAQAMGAERSKRSAVVTLPRDDHESGQTVHGAGETDGAVRVGVSRLQKRTINSGPTIPGTVLSFLPVVTYSSGGPKSTAVAVADLNGDGKLDLIVTSLSGPLGILLGNGDGTFQPAVTVGISGTFSAVADLNGDGKLDLVVTNDNLVGTVTVLLGNGDGSFQSAVTNASGGAYPISVAIADVNGDRTPDLLVANECTATECNAGTVSVLLGNGDGTFQPAVIYVSGGGNAWSIAVSDVNGDQRPDMIVGNPCNRLSCASGVVSVLLGNGNGTFQAAVTYDSGGIQALSIGIADVNGDGKPDVAVVNVQSDSLGVLLGNGDGTLQPVVTYAAGRSLGSGPQSLALADVNGDGKTDLILAFCNSQGLNCGATQGLAGVLLGNGDGTFQPVVTFGSGGLDAWAVVASDVNSDGRPDIIVANYCGHTYCIIGSVGVLLNGVQNSTSTLLSSSLNPSTYGQKVTWRAAVTSPGLVMPTGTVKFTWSGHTIGSALLDSSGIATFSKSNLNADPYPLTAVYVGDSANLGSTSAVLNQVVLQTTSSATLTSSPNPSAQGQAVTFTATISSPTVVPTGPITFTAGKTVLGTAQLSGGKTKLTISSLAVGSTKVTVTYYGNSNIAKSSASVTQRVH